MTINPIDSLSSLGTAQADSVKIADDFDTFLTLLTTQLQNQDPLEPLDTHQMTQQLVDFAGVEQSIQTNKNLETLSALSASNVITSAVDYIGKIATFSGDQSQLSAGLATWSYSSPDESAEAIFTIKDANGNDVYSETRALDQRSGTFNWNGTTSQGGIAPDGLYTLNISATNASGTNFSVSTQASGLVEGVDMSGAELQLIVKGEPIPFSDVSSVLLKPENSEEETS
ncbi:MAG: flagellar hook assembly protein FlgD [Methyloligellaceae bacterium]